MQLYLGLRPAGPWPGLVHDLLNSAFSAVSRRPPDNSLDIFSTCSPSLKDRPKTVVLISGLKSVVAVFLMFYSILVFVRVTLQSPHLLLLCRFFIKLIMQSKIVLLGTNLIVWERCVHTPFAEQQGHVRGKVPMSPSLIGAYPSALSLSHYGRGRMLC